METDNKKQNNALEEEMPHQPSDLYDDEIDETRQDPPEEIITDKDEKRARHEEFISAIHPVTKARMKLNTPKEDHILPNPNTEKEYEDFNSFLNHRFKKLKKDRQ